MRRIRSKGAAYEKANHVLYGIAVRQAGRSKGQLRRNRARVEWRHQQSEMSTPGYRSLRRDEAKFKPELNPRRVTAEHLLMVDRAMRALPDSFVASAARAYESLLQRRGALSISDIVDLLDHLRVDTADFDFLELELTACWVTTDDALSLDAFLLLCYEYAPLRAAVS